MPESSTDFKMTAAFLGHGILGSLPHANSIAPPAILVAYIRDPTECAKRAVRQIGSKGLWYMLCVYTVFLAPLPADL